MAKWLEHKACNPQALGLNLMKVIGDDRKSILLLRLKETTLENEENLPPLQFVINRA